MISAIIPALNSAGELRACLLALAGAGELIVVDGGSTDETAAIAESCGATVVRTERGRGRQMAAGAEAAKGDWLLFVHSDTRLEAGWSEAAEQHLKRRPDKAAYFVFRLPEAHWRARLLERAVAVRTDLLNLPYGDQGLLISRTLYDEVGGFAPMPLMEDVDIVRRIGSSRLVPLRAAALTSARRWIEDGWFARSLRNLACLLLYRIGVSPEKLVRIYR